MLKLLLKTTLKYLLKPIDTKISRHTMFLNKTVVRIEDMELLLTCNIYIYIYKVMLHLLHDMYFLLKNLLPPTSW